MKYIISLFRMLTGSFLTNFTQSLHVRLLNEWLLKPSIEFFHPHCTWKLADDHPSSGVHVGRDFYTEYTKQLADTYFQWNVVVNEVIGSSIGGIIVGEYLFQGEPNGQWCRAPFTQFYQIRRGQITDVRYFMGKVSRCETAKQLIELPALLHYCSPN